MTISVRRSGSADIGAIMALMGRSRGDALSPAQRAEQGFVQGSMNAEMLTRFQQGTGVFLAEEDIRLAGFAMTSRADTAPGGPPKLAADAAKRALGEQQRMFMYGPAAVAPEFQGRGVLTTLLTYLSRELRDRFDVGVAFVEDANQKSLAVHRHYGMTEVPGFRYQDRDYHVLVFPLELFTSSAKVRQPATPN
ncbi:MAG: GNAT family N-acetyltransferase [Mycobacterium sp.]